MSPLFLFRFCVYIYLFLVPLFDTFLLVFVECIPLFALLFVILPVLFLLLLIPHIDILVALF